MIAIFFLFLLRHKSRAVVVGQIFIFILLISDLKNVYSKILRVLNKTFIFVTIRHLLKRLTRAV